MAANYKRGDQVEVWCNEDGFYNSFYPATIISEINLNEFIVQYNTLMADNELHAHREFVDAHRIRPVPPEIVTNKFNMNDEVDAFANEGWWTGKVSKKIKGRGGAAMFLVTFEDITSGTLVVEKYRRTDLRVHQDWVGGHWVCFKKKF